MAQARSSASPDHPGSVQGSGPVGAPGGDDAGRWRRFLRKVGLSRRPDPDGLAAEQYTADLIPPPTGRHHQESGGWPAADTALRQPPPGYPPQGAAPPPPQHWGADQPWNAGQQWAAAPPVPQPAAPANGAAPAVDSVRPWPQEQQPPAEAPPARPAETPAAAATTTAATTATAAVVSPVDQAQTELLAASLAGMAMRDLSLVDSIIDTVEELEDTAEDPDLLEKLFKIDNLATRMRRNGENLLILAGQDSGDPSIDPIPLLDVGRAAISEISDYQRIRIGKMPELFISGSAADDLSHLLAELMENATAKSPEHAQVVVSAQAMADDRLLITVEDEGIGIPKERLESLNTRLNGAPVLDQHSVKHMGLYVASRIAHRHGLAVQLEARAFRGVSAHVVVPQNLFGTTGPAQPSSADLPRRPVAPPAPVPQPIAPTAPGTTQPGARQEGRSDMNQSSVTASGLPRRSAHRSGAAPEPLAEQPAAAEPEEPSRTPASRADRIRADLEGFLEGERAAGRDN
ncbi:histidine kinase/DNA gyrase B/HSP90-like ATPase [Murinocardiopsis flavida]|uniref:histidine kinase n=1 Tax=Murinocardiopsis flavida TaxID=645275 RepID=A0A2P8D578_9ACTN|nr:ATP-binding protein [Murinocardiopsis flavida]PSK92375.1 histidine kinase/DNA gyrase B/HSP90-like ATPase [Murinocardiopsis flavida]